MKSIGYSLLVLPLIILNTPAQAQDLDLNNYDASTFSNFAVVSGQVFGSGFYSTAAVHRFGGIDIGLKTLVGFVSKKSRTGPLQDTNVFNIPAFHVNIGLFNRYEIGVRYYSFRYGEKNRENASHTSGIVKFNLLKGIVYPDITLFSAYSRLTGMSDFSLNTLTFGGMIGKNFSLVTLYAGINYNAINMDVDLEPDEVRYTERFSDSIKKNVTHVSLGMSLGLAPFTIMNVEYNVGEVQTASLGIIFSFF